MRVPLAILLAMAMIPMASAHASAPPPDYMVRLLHDCNDDYFGDDSSITSRPGHDIHSLDLREAWSSELGNHVVFKIILNGDDDETITVALSAGGSKSYDFVRNNGVWSGTFAKVRHIEDIGDGNRFALEGSVRVSSLGSIGDTLRSFTVTGKSGGDTHDRIPGNDAQLGGCSDNYERPDYRLAGPIQYVSADFEDDDITAKQGIESLVALDLVSLTRDASQTVKVSLEGDGARLRLHDPDSGAYVEEAEFDLSRLGNQGQGKTIHIAIEGDSAGEGQATATITTSLGGRLVRTLDFTVTPADQEPAPDEGTEETPPKDEESPGAGLLLPLLIAFAWIRRR